MKPEPKLTHHKISQFDGINPTVLEKSATIEQIVAYIKNGVLKKEISQLRALPKKEYDKRKCSLPAVTFGGTFAKRNNSRLNNASGYACLDLDSLNNLPAIKQQLSHDVYVLMCFISPSGKGLKVVIPIPIVKNNKEYTQRFFAVKAHFETTFKISIDETPDISRLCFMSYDPEIYFNPEAACFTDIAKQQEQPPHPADTAKKNNSLSNSDISLQAAIDVLLQTGISDKIDRINFVGLCGAFRHANVSYEIFDAIMQKTPGYDSQNNLKIWNTTRPERDGSTTTAATIIRYATTTDKKLFREIRRSLKENQKVEKEPERYADKIAFYLRKHKIIYNELRNAVFIDGEMLTDASFAKMLYPLMNLGQKNQQTIRSIILALSQRHISHPIKEYLLSLKWDKQDHISKLAEYFEDTENIFPLYLRKWMIGAIAKIFDQSQNPMLVLIGGQGIGKGYFVQWLCPLPDLFISSCISPDNRDHQLRACDRWVWEVVELGSTARRTDLEALKAFLTQVILTVRRPYGHFDLDKPCTASFIGTINDDGSGFLSDTTGNRRYRPIYLTDIGWGYTQCLNKNQLWAQAFELWKQGERVDLQEKKEQYLRNTILPKYQKEDPMEILVSEYFAKDPKNILMSIEILNVLIDLGYRGKNTKADAMDLATVMKTLQVQKGRKENRRGYFCRCTHPKYRDNKAF